MEPFNIIYPARFCLRDASISKLNFALVLIAKCGAGDGLYYKAWFITCASLKLPHALSYELVICLLQTT